MSKKPAWLLSVIALCLLFSGTAASQPPGRAALALQKPHIPGELLVRVRPGAWPAIEGIVKALGGRVTKGFSCGLADLRLIKLRQPEGTEQLLTRLLGRLDVLYAEPNYIVEPALTPNDPEFYRSWGLHNTGQRYRRWPRRSGTDDIDVDAPEAWQTATGSNSVVVAVIDTGVNYSHPELAQNIWNNAGEIAGNLIDDDDNGFVDDIRGWNFRDSNNDPTDQDGHGTAVASVIGALGNNASGTCGVCWNISLMPLRVGLGETGSISQITQAINYAITNGAHVINASWGTTSYSQTLSDVINLARSANVVVVAAAGNYSSNIDASPYYPASFTHDNIITVAAVDANGNLATFSSYASLSVDIAAPGVDIYIIDGSFYNYSSGTSVAAPYASGVAALIISDNPGIPCADTCSRIITCASRLSSLQGKCVSAGMLNAYNALTVGEAAVEINSVSRSVLGAGDSATITWTCKHDGTYSVEVGGNGMPGSGTVVETGQCQLNDQIASVVTEADLPDNQASLVYVIIAEVSYAGFATATLYDDQTGPSTGITCPAPNSTLGSLDLITGTAEDTGGAEVANVRIALYDGSYYYNATAFLSSLPLFLDATGTTSWTFDSSSVPWSDGANYTIYVQGEDTVGNIALSESPVSFTYLAGAPTLTIESLSARVIGPGGSTELTWSSDLTGTYSVRVGGSEVDSGTCSADVPVITTITEADLTDNAANIIYIYVTAAAITGSTCATIHDDHTAPVSNIIAPINNRTYTELPAILGRASDTGSAGVAAVEVQIQTGSQYWNGIEFVSNPAWAAADGTNEWNLDTSSLPWTDFTYYTIRTRAVDAVGNFEEPTTGITFYFNSGTTVIVKDKDDKNLFGCTISNPDGGFSFSILLLTTLALFYLRRRRTITLRAE